jgi:hypothetical protein
MPIPTNRASPSGKWVVWLTDGPGRVYPDIWEAIVECWQVRARARQEGTHDQLAAKYGLQGPPAQRAAAARLGALAMIRRESPERAKHIVLYAYQEADSYLEAHAPEGDEEDAWERTYGRNRPV